MKKLKYIIIVLSCLLVFSRCSKDWIEPEYEDVLITQDSTTKKTENAEKFVNACYNSLVKWNLMSFSWIGMSSITSDDADKGSTPGDAGTDKDQMDNITYTPSSISVSEVWKGNFNGVSRCNQALANIPLFKIDDKLKNRLLGEAHFLRAYYYFTLVRCYGDLPILDKVVDVSNQEDLDKTNKREAVSKVYEFIENDLIFAKDNLPINSEYNSKEIGRATKGAAIGLLAKVSMYEKKWKEALDYTDMIINGSVGNYGLLSDYATIWREAQENSIESLFEIQCRGINPGREQLTVEGYTFVQAPRGVQVGEARSEVIVYPDGKSSLSQAWGFNTPSEDLVKAYEPGDKRKKATIMFVKDTLWDGAVLKDAANPRYNYKSYVSRKQESYTSAQYTNKNIRILRIGEIYLINAEAANELGQTAKGLASLNKIRNRAGLGDIASMSKDDLRNAIWRERRVELAMEHDRFFDLVRQGRAGEILRAQGKNFIDGKNEVFPIPQEEIDNSGGKLKQNPGY